jgi:phosphatidylglycerophosphate synthase
VPPSAWGKLKAASQFVAIGLAMLRPSNELGPYFLDEWAMLVAVVATIMSAWDYFSRFGTALRGTTAAR